LKAQYLQLGDIAFTGLNSTANTVNDFTNTPKYESNKEFSFVLLKNIPYGTTLYFTDLGWTSMQAFQTAEVCGSSANFTGDGIIKWEADRIIAAGTHITIRCSFTPKANIGKAIDYHINTGRPEYINLLSSGETIFAYSGSLTNPILVSAINAHPEGWLPFMYCEVNNVRSTLPNIFNNSFNYAFAAMPSPGSGMCMRLKPSTIIPTVSTYAARAVIYNRSNWEMNSAATPYSLLEIAENALPVNFGEITATVRNSTLSVRWQTLSETNCRQFTVEASADGSTWKAIRTVPSKVSNGNSSTLLNYDLDIELPGIPFTVAIIGLMLCRYWSRRYRYLALFTILMMLIACSKSRSIESATPQNLFLRIVQQDIDGGVHYSKVVRVAKP